MNHGPRTRDYDRWLHRWAVLTVCATFPLLFLGAEVTSTGSGLVDPQGFRLPWHMLTVPSLWERGLGYIIEHAHRVAGYVVGICIIVLAVSLWRREARRWVRWLGAAALTGVVLQGLFGGFRVQLHALIGSDLAFIHGCFAQIVFALLVSLALLTSQGWLVPADKPSTPQTKAALKRWSLLTAALVYGQIVFGGLVRHTDSPVGPRGHLLLAFVVLAAVVWLAKLTLDSRPADHSLIRPVLGLAVLVVLQLVLGVESWLAKFASARWPQLQPLGVHPELIRSAHYVVGSLIFAAAVVTSLRACRQSAESLGQKEESEDRPAAWLPVPASPKPFAHAPVAVEEGAV